MLEDSNCTVALQNMGNSSNSCQRLKGIEELSEFITVPSFSLAVRACPGALLCLSEQNNFCGTALRGTVNNNNHNVYLHNGIILIPLELSWLHLKDSCDL